MSRSYSLYIFEYKLFVLVLLQTANHFYKKQFSIEWQGASFQIFSKLSGKNGVVHLFRGVSEIEAEPLKAARRSLDFGTPANEVLKAYKKSVLDKTRDSIFFSNSEKVAQAWGRKTYAVELSIPREVWTPWTKKEDVYAGLEKSYVEVSLISDEALLFYIQNFKLVESDISNSVKPPQSQLFIDRPERLILARNTLRCSGQKFQNDMGRDYLVD